MIRDSKLTREAMSTIISRIDGRTSAVIESCVGKGKTVVETIDDLAGMWSGLGSEEKTEVSIVAAGRYHMGEFVALMENHNSEENKHRND